MFRNDIFFNQINNCFILRINKRRPRLLHLLYGRSNELVGEDEGVEQSAQGVKRTEQFAVDVRPQLGKGVPFHVVLRQSMGIAI